MYDAHKAGGSPAIPAPPPPDGRLKAERVQQELAALPYWALEENGTALTRSFRFKSTAAPFAFAAFVGTLAAESGHFPVVTIVNRSLFCRIASPEVGALTAKDFELAKQINLIPE